MVDAWDVEISANANGVWRIIQVPDSPMTIDLSIDPAGYLLSGLALIAAIASPANSRIVCVPVT
jgi:hypothetical protein